MIKKNIHQTPDVKFKIIKDFRIYTFGLPNKTLYPYDYQYADIFRSLLSKHELLLPNYDHIFIQIGTDHTNPFPEKDWSRNEFVAIDYNGYLLKSEKEKEQIVFNLIIIGIKNIFERDKLDQNILDKTITEVSKCGLETELEFKTIENKKYLLKVTYFSRPLELLNPVFIELIDKNNSISKKLEIGKIDQLGIFQWLRKITLTNSKILIKSSNSLWANVILKDYPRTIEYSIDDFLK